MSIDKYYGNIRDSLCQLCNQLTGTISSCRECSDHRNSHQHTKIFNPTQIEELMEENEYCVHGQYVVNKIHCTNSHGLHPTDICGELIKAYNAVLLYTNKTNIVVVTLAQRYDNLVFDCKKTNSSFTLVLDKFMIDLIKKMDATIEVVPHNTPRNPSITYNRTPIEEGKYVFYLLISAFKKYTDEIAILQYEYESKSTQTVVQKTMFDELDKLFDFEISSTSCCDFLSKKKVETQINFEELAC